MGYKTTVRYPNSRENILDVMSNFYKHPETSRQVPVLNPGRNLTERVVYILQAYSTYTAMSSNRLRTNKDGSVIPDKENWGSVEDIHNAVHNYMGGSGGHMASVPVSAFDPIFWLRECLQINTDFC